MTFPKPAHFPESIAMFTRGPLAALALTLALPAYAQTAEPTSTTATYGNWTVSCALTVLASSGSQTPVKTCEMTTRLDLKGNDGQTRPLLQLAIGQPPGSETARIALQVPVDVALREPVAISLDQTPTTGDAQQAVPQELLVSATYLACSPGGCLADTAIAAELVGRLKAAKTVNVTFTSLNAGKRITVPVPLSGFGDAADALGLADK
jgi:invasion protein IalB